jgi:hypothetical protein
MNDNTPYNEFDEFDDFEPEIVNCTTSTATFTKALTIAGAPR